jgi:hypothetical protein
LKEKIFERMRDKNLQKNTDFYLKLIEDPFFKDLQKIKVENPIKYVYDKIKTLPCMRLRIENLCK